MSTVFGVLTSSGKIIEIAFRSKTIYFTNELAELLNDDVKVIPLDNTVQGIETIGDIKKEINNQKQQQ